MPTKVEGTTPTGGHAELPAQEVCEAQEAGEAGEAGGADGADGAAEAREAGETSMAAAKAKCCITIMLPRRQDAPPLPDLDSSMYTPPGQRIRRIREIYAEEYGAHPVEIEAIESFALKHRLAVKSSDAIRRYVVVEGTAEQLSNAFATGFYADALRQSSAPKVIPAGRSAPRRRNPSSHQPQP